MTTEEKQSRKDAKIADKAQALADNALAKLPAEKERRNELFREGDALKAEAQSVAGQIGQHKKRLHEVFGITKQALVIRNTLMKCPDGVFDATIQQTLLFIKDMDRPVQLNMFELQAGKGVAEDGDSVFDKTSSGERHDAERLDDPGRARRRKADAAPPPAPSPAMPLDEAKAAFEANAHKAPKPKSDEPPSPPSNDDDEDLRPRFLKNKSSDPLPGAEGTGSYKLQ